MNLNTIFLLILTTARIVLPGMPSEVISEDGAVRKTPAPVISELAMSLSSSSSAKGRATVYVPAGLNQGEAVRLMRETVEPELPTEPAVDSSFTINSYWGSSKLVQEGQPFTGLTKGMSLSLQDMPKESHAYWPDLSRRGPKAATSAAGKYKLYTDYCGNAFFNIPATEDFLPAIDLADLPARIDLSKPLTLSWKPVFGAVAYFLVASGGNASQTAIWSSSSQPDYPDGLDIKALTAQELESMLASGVLLSDKQTSCTIPAGVFLNADSAVITMLAIGRDRVEKIGGIDVRIIRRSQVSVPISPKLTNKYLH